jgi:murein L,D-transpeptidase YafK
VRVFVGTAIAAGLLALGALAASPALAKKKPSKEAAESAQALDSPVAERQDGEKLAKQVVSDAELTQVYLAIQQGHSKQALNQIETLLKRAPNYKLLHLLHADLLLILSHRSASKAARGGLPALNAEQTQRVKELQQEAWLRLSGRAALAQATTKGLVPKQLVKLADNERYALVVDSKASRLYVYQNVVNAAPKLISDHYITQGKLGVFKSSEGDKRTPVGAYFLTGPIKTKLPDLYGFGALGMDYPNAWDKTKGRTGHGIWMHGVPRDTYARAPYASDGCIALSNPEMATMFKLAGKGSIPIVVTDQFEFVEASAVEKVRQQLSDALQGWLKADKKRSAANLVILEYPGEAGLMLTRFQLLDTADKSITKKELYWKKDAAGWKVVLDNNL